MSQLNKRGSGSGGGISFVPGTPDSVPVEKASATTLAEYTPPTTISFEPGLADGVPVEKTSSTTLGEYTPPTPIDFDVGVNNGDILKRTGTYTIGTVTAIAQSLIVNNDEITSFVVAAPNLYEVGESVAACTFNWTMLRNANANISQIISGTNLVDTPVAVTPGTARTYAGTFSPALAPVTNATYTYTLNTVGDDSYADSATASIGFSWKRYFGVSDTDVLTGAQVMSVLNIQGNEYGSSRAVTKTFDGSIGTPPNHLYYAYPAAWGAITSSTFNGFSFTDYSYSNGVSFGNAVPSALVLTNAHGASTNYYIVRTNLKYGGASLIWAIA